MAAVIILLLLLLFTITTLLANLINKKKRAAAAAKLPPLPPSPAAAWPLLGNLPAEVLIHKKPMFRWIHEVMKDMDTDICLIRLPGGANLIPVLDPAIAREMLRKQDAVFADRPVSFGSHTISGGYVTTAAVPYNDHHCVAGKGVDVRVAAQHYCGNVMRKIVFGRRFFGRATLDGGPGPMEVEHVEAVLGALKCLYWSCLSDYFPCLWGWDVDGKEKVIKEANETIRRCQDPIIDERIRQWRSGERKEMDDLLDVFITLKDEEGKPLLTPHEIKSQAVVGMMAGIDNPSNAVEWAMAELINQPYLMAKATKEIDLVVGKENRMVQESDIDKLNYVKACAREAFRLHPLLPFNAPHVATQDTIVGGYFIPKGSSALLSRYGLGRNPKTWTNSLKFDPERHLKGDGDNDEVVLTEHDLRFVSFSTGRRGCIAAMLGTCMTTMLLARLLQCFAWSPTGNAKFVDLTEADDQLSLATPLKAFPVTRLTPDLYPVI
ncbi:unnamed protein product [Linum tenue]|uniref:Cytochrome P450 n=2 Tax=Linum tenue TaxID=586396 RepID=A0AAV0LV27_9ROSI|nr:unnamed protein product [Linum tenue]